MLYKKTCKIIIIFCIVFSNVRLFGVKKHKKPAVPSSSSSPLLTCTKQDCKKKMFISEARLKQHENNVHGPGSKLVVCTVPGCNKSIKTYTLRDHIRYSHAPKIECSKCGRAFSKHAMYKHLQMTHGERFHYLEASQSSSPIIQTLEQRSDSQQIASQENVAPIEMLAVLDPAYDPGTDENNELIKTLCEITNN